MTQFFVNKLLLDIAENKLKNWSCLVSVWYQLSVVFFLAILHFTGFCEFIIGTHEIISSASDIFLRKPHFLFLDLENYTTTYLLVCSNWFPINPESLKIILLIILSPCFISHPTRFSPDGNPAFFSPKNQSSYICLLNSCL